LSSISIASDDKYDQNHGNSSNQKWVTLHHNGVCFPPEYIAKNLPFKIDNQNYTLNKDQEELIYAWTKKKDTHYVQDPIFQQNFLTDFKRLLPKDIQNSIHEVGQLDMSEFMTFVDSEKAAKEREKIAWGNLAREERKKIALERKKERETLRNYFGKAVVDDIEVEVANWLVEPPGLFMGRGQHPLRGRWKPRVKPEDVILNLGEEAAVPEGPWQKIIHDHTSTWLASWIEMLTGKRKYVWLHDSSLIRQNYDKAKYDKAQNLEKYFDKVEREIVKKMTSKDRDQRKISTVCYLIIKMAMRVGDEKDPDEADTVGATTLRKEHLKFKEIDEKNRVLEFSFLGKDSVPWQKSILVDSEDKLLLFNNLNLFIKNKKETDPIFDNINSMKVNTFLRNIDTKNVPGLTAKVFRTFIATNIVKKSLKNPPIIVKPESTESEKIYVAKYANLQAAITCNHKKGIDPKNPASITAIAKYEESMKKKIDLINNLKADLKNKNWKTENQQSRLVERVQKLEFQVRLQKETREYNLGTSLRNYIDPRVFRSWMNIVELDWTKMYTSTLQRKFLWVDNVTKKELKAHFAL